MCPPPPRCPSDNVRRLAAAARITEHVHPRMIYARDQVIVPRNRVAPLLLPTGGTDGDVSVMNGIEGPAIRSGSLIVTADSWGDEAFFGW